MPRRFKPVVLAVVILIAGIVAIPAWRGADRSAAGPGAGVTMDQWTTIAFDLEDTIPARALLGGIRNSVLDQRLDRQGLSWESWRQRAKDLIARVGALGAERRSAVMIHEAMSMMELDPRIVFDPRSRPIDEDPSLDEDTEALVQRLLLRLPAER